MKNHRSLYVQVKLYPGAQMLSHSFPPPLLPPSLLFPPSIHLLVLLSFLLYLFSDPKTANSSSRLIFYQVGKSVGTVCYSCGSRKKSLKWVLLASLGPHAHTSTNTWRASGVFWLARLWSWTPSFPWVGTSTTQAKWTKSGRGLFPQIKQCFIRRGNNRCLLQPLRHRNCLLFCLRRQGSARCMKLGGPVTLSLEALTQ